MTPIVSHAVLAVREDLLRALEGLDDRSGALRLGGLNEAAWIVAHLAEQEQRYWLASFGLPEVAPEVAPYRRGRSDEPLTLSEALDAWQRVAAATAPRLRRLGAEELERRAPDPTVASGERLDVMCLRVFGHYYLHIGQITAVRRWLGLSVPPFVGRLPDPAAVDR
jgi:uncharacterized damage-inducible protein DinB